MRILIAGIGALGGTIAARAISSGVSLYLCTRTSETARYLRSSGLRVSGIGGTTSADSVEIAPISDYKDAEKFHLILLATKAQDALEISPSLKSLLAPHGTLLPIQNGAISEILSERLGNGSVLGGVSNLAATMIEPGVYEQKNAGHLLVGEFQGGTSKRIEEIKAIFRGAIEIRASSNIRGAIWSKLLLNCSVTTIGAISGQTMRQYVKTDSGKLLFRRAYQEALSVAIANGTRLEKMIVDPMPPGWGRGVTPEEEYNSWIEEILVGYGDLKPSMLQDFERKKATEIDFINGYVALLGEKLGVDTRLNQAITDMVHRIEQQEIQPGPERLDELLTTIRI